MVFTLWIWPNAYTQCKHLFRKFLNAELMFLEQTNDTLYIGFESRTYGQNIVLHIGIMSFFAFFEDGNSEYVILNGHIWDKCLNLVSLYLMLRVLEHPNNILYRTCKLKAVLFCNVMVHKQNISYCLHKRFEVSLSCRGPGIYKRFLLHLSF